MTPPNEAPGRPAPLYPVILLAGLSGAGKTSAMNVLEDLRFLALDGLPPVLLPNLIPQMLPMLQGRPAQPPLPGPEASPSRRDERLDPVSAPAQAWRGLAIGLDLHQGGPEAPPAAPLEELRTLGFAPTLIFMEASTDAIIRRYAATRRPHPLTLNQGEGGRQGLEQAIQNERLSLEPLRAQADLLIDTSSLSIHELRRLLQSRLSSLTDRRNTFHLHLVSFGFKYGIPAEAEMVHDLRFLPNPYFVEALRPMSGLKNEVAAYVLDNGPGREVCGKLGEFLEYLLPLYQAEGRYRLTIAFGCTGGRHRSVAVAEYMAGYLRRLDYRVSVEHRHLSLG